MDEIVKEYEKMVESFDLKYFLGIKDYASLAALSALETTNEIQKNYFSTVETKFSRGENIMRLYALLQGLFVSVDALYALALSLTKSKNFININNNKNLRELKYIRNDVVGHPANRVLSNEAVAYCILDSNSITPKNFKYHIYTTSNINEKEVSVIDLVTAYYEEANNFLDELYKVSKEQKNNTILSTSINNVLNLFNHNEPYLAELDNLIKLYKEVYPTSKKEQHRALWRYEVILKLYDYHNNDPEKVKVMNYVIGLELEKLHEMFTDKPCQAEYLQATPSYVAAFYRFLNKNRDLYEVCDNLKDFDNPLFKSSLEMIKKRIIEKNFSKALCFLEMLDEAFMAKDYINVYALSFVIIRYKRK